MISLRPSAVCSGPTRMFGFSAFSQPRPGSYLATVRVSCSISSS